MNVDYRAVTAVQLLVLILYSGGLVLFALWVSKRVEGSGSFFVADRALGPGLVFSTFAAANIGAGSIIGASGLGYRTGISAWWWVGSAGIGSLLLAFWVGPRIWRVARDQGLYTAGDYLEERYGSSVRAVVASLLWVLTLVVLAAQLIAMSQILQWVLGVPQWVGAVVGGLVVTTYFAAGGLLTSAWVNMVQLVILLTGFAIGVPLALSRAGGWSAVVAAAPPDPLYFDFWAQTGLIFFVLIVPAFIVSPGLLQKAFGARDERALRIGIGAQGLVLLVFAMAPPLVGMIARIYAPELSGVDAELAVPIVLTEGLPLAFGALGLAAVFSAELSSADAILFMLSTSLSKDIYKRYVAPEADDDRVLQVARWAAVAGGLCGVLLAVVIPTVIDSLTVFYSVLSVSLFVPVVAGLHTRRAGVPEALAAIGVGVTVLIAVRISALGEISIWLNPTALGLTASAVAFAVLSLMRRESSSAR